MNAFFRIQARSRKLAAILLLAAPAAMHAETWLGGTGDYNTGANWDTGAVPGETADVTISSGAATINGNLLRSAATTVDGSGQLIVNGRFINSFDGGSGTFNVAGAGVLTQTGNYFIVSTRTFDGTFNQTGGTVNAVIDRGFFMSDGDGVTAESGYYNALGGIANFEMVSTDVNNDLHNFQAGRRGTNDSFVVDGGDVNFTATTENRRMYFSQDASLEVSSGTFDANGFEYFVVGYGTRVSNGANLSGTARMVVSGGAATINPTATGAFVVSDGQEGVVEVSGGSLTIGGEVRLGGDVRASNGDGRGDFLQSGGTVDVAGAIVIAPNGTGSYALKGGALSANDLVYGGGFDSFFAFEGGTLTLEGDDRSVVNESWFAAPFGANASYSAGTDTTTITRNAGVQNLQIEVDTQTGAVTLRNPNPSFAIDTDYYEIRSAGGALAVGSWSSLDQQVADGGSSPDGDYNADGVVDAADYTVWRDTLNTSVSPGTGADGDGDGTVDADDYDLWEANYGAIGVGTGWTEAGGASDGLLAEYYLEEGGFSLAGGASYSLGSAFDPSVFGAGSEGDLTFSWETPGGYLVEADVVYLNASAAVAVPEPGAIALLILTAVAWAKRRCPA